MMTFLKLKLKCGKRGCVWENNESHKIRERVREREEMTQRERESTTTTPPPHAPTLSVSFPLPLPPSFSLWLSFGKKITYRFYYKMDSIDNRTMKVREWERVREGMTERESESESMRRWGGGWCSLSLSLSLIPPHSPSLSLAFIRQKNETTINKLSKMDSIDNRTISSGKVKVRWRSNLLRSTGVSVPLVQDIPSLSRHSNIFS